MAGKKKPLTGIDLAASKVDDQGRDSRFIFSLPVNPQFADPNEVDEKRGVKYPPAPENRYAEAGLVRHVQAALFPADVSRWIAETGKRKGGLPRLAADLAAMIYNPAAKPTKKLSARAADEANMLRALQRAAPPAKGERKESHGTISKALYRRRIALLRIAEARQLVIGVRGLWTTEDKGIHFRVFNSDPTDPEQAAEAAVILRGSGAGFIEEVIAIAGRIQPYPPELLQTHELRVEVSA